VYPKQSPLSIYEIKFVPMLRQCYNLFMYREMIEDMPLDKDTLARLIATLHVQTTPASRSTLALDQEQVPRNHFQVSRFPIFRHQLTFNSIQFNSVQSNSVQSHIVITFSPSHSPIEPQQQEPAAFQPFPQKCHQSKQAAMKKSSKSSRYQI
jgi:hypothetical protein